MKKAEIITVIIAAFLVLLLSANHLHKPVHGQVTQMITSGQPAPVVSSSGLPGIVATCNSTAVNVMAVSTANYHTYFCNGSSWIDLGATLAPTSFTLGGAPLSYAGVISSASTAPAALTPGQCAETSFTFTGAVVGAQITMPVPPSAEPVSVAISGARVTAANTVAIRFCDINNVTTYTPTAGVYTAAFFW